MLQFLALERKLIAICSDNAKNNLTLVEHLFKQLGKEFDIEHDDVLGNYKDIMWFRGKESHIQCLGHILNIVVHAILKELKARTMKEALEDRDTPTSGISKLRYIVI